MTITDEVARVMQQAVKRIERDNELLLDLLEYFEDREDINEHGGPNEAMRFADRIRKVLGK